jgi:hypothetical protein
MKRCRKCRKAYSDDSLNFCLDDGSPLFPEPDSDPTMVSPRATVPIPQSWTNVSSPPATSRPSSFRWPWLAALVLIAMALGGGAVAFVYHFSNSDSRSGEQTTKPETTLEQKPARPASTKESTEIVQPTPSRPPNLAGEWTLVNTIEHTSFPAYKNLRLGYHLVITQNGADFSGAGEKTTENDRAMSDSERTPIRVTGSIVQGRVTATFDEEGQRRNTAGTFAWTIASDGNQLRGTFDSSAAKSSGPSIATRTR